MISNELLSLLLVGSLVICVVLIFIKIAMILRRRGGSLMTIMYGATDELYTKDKKEQEN